MGRMIDDSVKQKLLDSLAEEPTMVLSTAYVYAKNYVEYGEDITKAWTTAVQQASILEQIKIKAKKEAYDSFKKEYENRLNADLVAMLTDFLMDIEENTSINSDDSHERNGKRLMRTEIIGMFEQKINALKEKK